MGASRLRAVPQNAERAIGLVRVSKERDGMIAPEMQQVAISDYASARGYQLVTVVEGLDESGSNNRSAWWAKLDQAVGEVQSGAYDVIVVWKFSRFARNRLRWAVALDKVEAAGGRLESATEQLDSTTSTGRFTRGMLAELQAFEAERIGEVWKEVHSRRVSSGKPANGKPRYGYAYDPVEKVHVPDPETGPVLADVFRRYVAGESVYALVRWLNGHGFRTTNSGLWSDRSLRRVMDSGFAAGLFNAGAQLHQGVHEPLIDPGLWQLYLDSREKRRAGPRRERSQYVLSGLVRCARCERPMVAGQFGDAREPKYRCKTGKEQGPMGCSGGYVMASFVERTVMEWLQELATDVDTAKAAQLAQRARRTTARADSARLGRELTRAEDALTRLAVQHATSPLPDAVYATAYAELVAQVNELTAAVEAAGRDARAAAVDPRRTARALLADWDVTQVGVRREILSSLLAYVDVTTGRPRGLCVPVPAFQVDG